MIIISCMPCMYAMWCHSRTQVSGSCHVLHTEGSGHTCMQGTEGEEAREQGSCERVRWAAAEQVGYIHTANAAACSCHLDMFPSILISIHAHFVVFCCLGTRCEANKARSHLQLPGAARKRLPCAPWRFWAVERRKSKPAGASRDAGVGARSAGQCSIDM